MTYDSLVNRGDYFSAHYLADVLPRDLKTGLLADWKQREEETSGEDRATDALPVTPRAGLRALRRGYFRERIFFAAGDGSELDADDEGEPAEGSAKRAEDDAATYDSPEWCARLRAHHAEVLRALGYDATPGTVTVARAEHSYEVQVAHAEQGLVALDCGWSSDPDAALDAQGAGRLLAPLHLDGQHTLTTGAKLASFLFAADDAPRYVLLLVGGVVVLADRLAWGEGRYLAVSLDTALERNDTKVGGELDVVAALFGADSLRTPQEGGENPLAELVGKSTKHAVGVSSELRDGLRTSVELIAGEVLARLHEAGVRPEQVGELDELGKQLTRESLRYLYRILFLLYAEARPELGILPSDYPEYQQGYGLGRLGELVAERQLVDEKSRNGVYLYESLDLLFRKVQEGYRPRRTHGPEAAEEKESEDIGLRFESLHSKLFEPASIRLIGECTLRDPRTDIEADAEGEGHFLDTRLRNATLYRVLRLLMLTRGKKGERGGFISYAQLGINQLGAVYEGLMSYSGSIAGEELFEVAKNGEPKDGSWLVPARRAAEYEDSVFVRTRDEETGEERRMRYAPGSFVYRLSGRDRQTSASYYTPESLTRVTVQLALQHRLDQDGTKTRARELLEWRICEPALGSGAFLNEAINQVAAEYLRRRQDELGIALDPERYPVELQKTKAYIALHNSYGVDLNDTAVELAEVSLWLNTMHPGMEAPWFGLHLRRGNSLVGGRREIYGPSMLKRRAWLGSTPERLPLADADGGKGLPDGAVHHFLLPAKEWGAVAVEKEAKTLAPQEAKALGAWRKAITKSPTPRQIRRLQGLAKRAEYLWGLVTRRLEISERDISRRIEVWEAEDDWLRSPEIAVQRDEVLADLESVDTPYWRLKKLMDAWCALWFWPVQRAGLLDGTDEEYARAAQLGDGGVVSSSALAGDDEIISSFAQTTLLGEEQQVDVSRAEIEKSRAKRSLGRKRTGNEYVGERRSVIPLSELEDWLDFAEALLGTREVPAGSFVSTFDTLDELARYEDELPDWMGMDRFHQLESRFPWTRAVKDIAEQQGFFHWELEYAPVFAGRGGFDLQVGNPPWVRPTWKEDEVLAELEPWFMLASKPTVEEWRFRKSEVLLSSENEKLYVLDELAKIYGVTAFLSCEETYRFTVGTQPDLYRGFMHQVWDHANQCGITGLIHPDTHFGGAKDGALRQATYGHLRMHAHFVNERNIFSEIGHPVNFGLHVYGIQQSPKFVHVSWLFDPNTLVESLQHGGHGPLPGVKSGGTWDVRPHWKRVTEVDEALLRLWARLAGTDGVSPDRSPLLYPVTTEEQGAISALAGVVDRLQDFFPFISSGYHEKLGKEEGYISWHTCVPGDSTDVVLQGPHIHIACPIFKQPNEECRSKGDWSLLNLPSVATDFVPRTNYRRSCKKSDYVAAQDQWGASPYSEYFRLAWRRMIPTSNERSLFAAVIPPGPTHVHTVQSMAISDDRLTVLNAGFWASLPLDYFLRISGRSDLNVAEARKMPAVSPGHPLIPALLVRALRLNCLTSAYGPLWEKLYEPTWCAYEDWALQGEYSWPNLGPLAGHLKRVWEYDTPLRTEYERRCALVELDALVSVWLGITAEQLVAIYKSRYPQLHDYEAKMYFDANGRKIAANHNTYGYGQTKQDYIDLLAHLENPEQVAPPEGYEAPFYKADREREMRAAHATFQARLDAEVAAGRWTPPEPK